MSRWRLVTQWFFPPEFRIGVSRADPTAALLVSSLTEIADRIGKMAAKADTVSLDQAVLPAAGGGLEKGFVVDLCNNFHRLSRSAKPFQDGSGSEAVRMNRSFEQLRKVLHDNGIECVDLTGQVYEPGRSDFESLGEPQPTPGLARTTIIQCERPLVRLKGKMIQPGKGIVGRPAAG